MSHVPDDLVRLYRETYAREAKARLREIYWAGKEPSAEVNDATDAAYWEASRIALAAVLARSNDTPQTAE